MNGLRGKPHLHLATVSPADEDEELLALARANDPSAGRNLWNRYGMLIASLSRKALGPDVDVDDVIQDAFMGLVRGIHRVRGAATLRSYVVSVTMNAVRLELRRRRIRRLVSLTPSGVLPETEQNGTSAPARVAMKRLFQILDDLSYDERSCYVLHHIEELHQDEVAKAMGMSLATVKRRLVRANERVARRAKQDPFLKEYFEGRRGEAKRV